VKINKFTTVGIQKENGIYINREGCRLGDCTSPPIPYVIAYDYTFRVFFCQLKKLAFAQKEMAHIDHSAMFFVHT
jgi:hypothetical protein